MYQTKTIKELFISYKYPIITICVGITVSITGFFITLHYNFVQLKKDFEIFSQRQHIELSMVLNNYIRGIEILHQSLSNVTITELKIDLATTPLFLRGSFSAFFWVPEKNNPNYTAQFASFPQNKNRNHNIAFNTHPEIINALATAKESKAIATAKTLQFLPHKTAQTDLAFIIPILSNNKITGYIIGILDLEKVFKEEMKWNTPETPANILLYETKNGKNTLFYNTFNPSLFFLNIVKDNLNNLQNISPFHYKNTITLKSGLWHIAAIPTQSYLFKAANIFPWTVLASLITITTILSAFTLSLTKSNIETSLLLKTIEKTEKELSTVLKTILESVIVVDSKGIIQSANSAVKYTFGYKPKELVGKNIKTLMPKAYAKLYSNNINNYLRTGQKEIIGTNREIKAKRRDGSIFDAEIGINEMQIGKVKKFVGVIKDITAFKEREGLLKEQKTILNRSNQELEQFAYAASHDLKAPLRGIDQLAGWLEEDLGKSLTGENKENMQTLRNRVERMKNLLDSLLEYSRAGRNIEPEKNPVLEGKDIADDITILTNPPEGFNIIASDSFQTLKLKKMPIQQVLFNLVNNAIKHHHKQKGNITISANDNNDHYEFSVHDDGPGIPKELQGKAFEMFQTLKPRDKVEGVGMGLALVKKIVTNRGGSITVKSTKGSGTNITFTWPKERTANDKLNDT